VLRGYLGLRGTGRWEWRKLHNEEPNDLCSLPTIVRVVESRKKKISATCGMYEGGELSAQGVGVE
jgi:hypothetical protein